MAGELTAEAQGHGVGLGVRLHDDGGATLQRQACSRRWQDEHAKEARWHDSGGSWASRARGGGRGGGSGVPAGVLGVSREGGERSDGKELEHEAVFL